MLDLADMFEGWAQDQARDMVDTARLLGMADAFRAVAEAAGPGWSPPKPERGGLLAFLAMLMRVDASASA
jgi:hypothetical protein